jgi:hypothetical protein
MPSTSTLTFLPTPQSELTLFHTAYAIEQSRLRHQSHLASIAEARRLVTSIIHAQWPEHLWPSIKVTCQLTMRELRDIAYLRRQSDGIRACGRLVRAPVIHQQVAESLWEALSARPEGYAEGEGEEQEQFEMEVVARAAAETNIAMEENRLGEEQRKGRVHGSTHYQARPRKTLRDGRDRQEREVRPSRETGRLDGLVWQREETTCPCLKTFEAAAEEPSSDDHGSETSADKDRSATSSPSTSSSASSRSSLSQVFAWGRRV